jgi:outer membrane protein assembly factor BamE (lipoprotein component of BamABCDE complex)
MQMKSIVLGAGLCFVAASAARAGPHGGSISDATTARVTPGVSTKAQVQSLLGAPWRVVQFNDCGKPMPGQADETWDYRGKDADGAYRLHIEFDDRGVTNLVAKIPEHVAGGKGTAARTAPSDSKMAMKM